MMKIAWLTVLPILWAKIGWTFEPLYVRPINRLGRVWYRRFSGALLYARDYRQLNSDSLDPDGCLVRSSNFVLIKDEIAGAKQRRQVHHGEHNANKIRIFVTGEVFFIDIDLLMGAKILNLAKVHSTTDNIKSLFLRFEFIYLCACLVSSPPPDQLIPHLKTYRFDINFL